MVTVNQITPIPISSLPAASTLTGNEPAPIVQGGQTVQVPINQMPQGMTAGVVTYGNTGGSPFPNYRTLHAGNGLTISDAGAQGNLTVSVTSPFPGDITGNAATATALQTARTINGVSFNGTANIVIPTTDGFYLTTMSTANTGAQNSTALQNDASLAGGKLIVVPDGNYTVAHTSISVGTLNIWFLPGSFLIPDATLYRDSTNAMVQTSSTNVTLYGLYVNGNNNGGSLMWRSDGGDYFKAYNTTMINVGGVGLAAPANNGVWGFILKTVSNITIDGWTGYGFNDSTSTNFDLSFVRQIFIYNCGHFTITNAYCYPGTSIATNQKDWINILDDQVAPTTNGEITNSKFIYDQYTRRCIKPQGGWTYVSNIDMRPTSDFTPVSGSTQIGLLNLNGIDYASPLIGGCRVSDSYLDCTGFQVAVGNSGGANGYMRVDNCEIIGPILNVIRNFPDTGAPENQPAICFFSAPNDVGSGMSNCIVKNFGTVYNLQGSANYITDNVFNDPVVEVGVSGFFGETVYGHNISRNTIFTVTAGYLNSTRIIRAFDGLNYQFTNNSLIENGNTGHATRFIEVLIGTITGFVRGSIVPSGTTPFVDFFSSGMVNLDNNGVQTVAGGGVGQNTYAIGDLLYASTTTALSKRAAVTIGQALLSQGTGTAPAYGVVPIVLSQTSGIDAKIVGTTNLYTVPAGKTAVITGAIVRCTAASSVSGGPTLGIGVAAGEQDIFASTALTTLTTTAKIYGFQTSGVSISAAAAAVVKCGVDVASTSISQTLAIDLQGYLTN